jgi:hypothetical protein
VTARQQLDESPALRSYVGSHLRPGQQARALRRLEAGERDMVTPHERTRAHREGRCVEHAVRRPKSAT